MFSVIVSTIRDVEALEPIFSSSNPLAELIIIDSRWSNDRRERIMALKHSFKRVVYAPPKPKKEGLKHDFISANNTGLAYAEEPWMFCIGDSWELKPDFWDKLKETIDTFGELLPFFGIRPLELEPWNGDEKWESYVAFKQRYFILPCQPLGKDGLRRVLPIITCGAAILQKETWYAFNGFDERYDVGAGWYDNELFDRIVMKRLPFIFDQELMTFRNPHEKIFSKESRDECERIYAEKNINVDGTVTAPNDFDLKELHEKLMMKKEEYIL